MKNILNYLSLLCILATVASCDKFTDVHAEYIKGGEIIYAVKPDSIVFVAGKQRLKMRLWMENGQNIKDVIVKWNGGEDSLVIPAKFKTGLDSIDVLIPGLEEKSYSFDIHTIDNFGNSSLTYTQFGSTYGATYQASLQNRRVKAASLTDVVGKVEWYAPAENMVFTEVKFVNLRGTDTTVRFPASDFSVDIEIPADAEFQFRSLYIPEAEAIDTFATAWSTDKVPDYFTFDRSTWEVIAVSDEKVSDGGGKTTLIDGDLSTYWHSEWSPNKPLPHWAIIDMKNVKNIGWIEIYRRSGNKDAKTAQIFVGNSDDPSGAWTLAGEGVFGSGDMQRIDNTGSATGRYLKIYLPDSNRDVFTSIAEIYAFGK